MNRFSKALDVGPVLLLAAVAVWHLALGISAATVIILRWDGEWLSFAADHLMWAFACAYVAMLMHENRRLRKSPSWRAADTAWRRGFEAGRRSA